MKRDFNEWLSTFRPSIADYGYYVDFKKVFANIENIKVPLNILNSLIGSKNIEADFRHLVALYPETLRCIPILLAVRDLEIRAMDGDGAFVFDFNVDSTAKWMNLPNATVDLYVMFMFKTGLFDLIQNHIINNLVDYATGVETGLDSNGRKNRGGHLMEDLVESFLKKNGLIKGVDYFDEMYIHEVEQKWGLNLSAISNQGSTEKRFDYVVVKNNNYYLIETNFYASGGSKLNETARSYKTLANEISTIPNVQFVWFTDGTGWRSARGNLRETFDVMDHIYNIKDMENGIMSHIFI